MQFIDLKSQYQKIKSKVDERIHGVLNHGAYIFGPEIKELEEQMTKYLGVNHTIACGNGTDALAIALRGLGIRPGDEVVTPAFSFFAGGEMISQLGAKPVFCEVDERTFNTTADYIRAVVTPNTKAVLNVSLYGLSAPMEEIRAVCDELGLFLIEDAAQAFGATWKGKSNSSYAHVSTTSFFPAKPLGCYGDGGAIFAQDDEVAAKIRRIANHGQQGRYNHVELGFNSRLDSIQAAVLIEKLAIFDEERIQRQKIADRYNAGLEGAVATPVVPADATSVWAQYTIQVSDREALAQKLKDAGIPTSVHYPKTIPEQPAMAYLGVNAQDFPNAYRLGREVLSLPMHPYLAQEDQDRIIEAVKAAL